MEYDFFPFFFQFVVEVILKALDDKRDCYIFELTIVLKTTRYLAANRCS